MTGCCASALGRGAGARGWWRPATALLLGASSCGGGAEVGRGELTQRAGHTGVPTRPSDPGPDPGLTLWAKSVDADAEAAAAPSRAIREGVLVCSWL